MAALGWLLNLGFAGGEVEVATVVTRYSLTGTDQTKVGLVGTDQTKVEIVGTDTSKFALVGDP